MGNYRPQPLKKTDDNITLNLRSETGSQLYFKVRLSGWSTSYIITFVKDRPFKIWIGRQADIIEGFNDLLNGQELEVIRNSVDISETQIKAYT